MGSQRLLPVSNMEPVKSKKLFNFHLKGTVDDDIVQTEKKMFAEMELESIEEMSKVYDKPPAEIASFMRSMVDSLECFFAHPILIQGYAECDHDTLEVPTDHCGNYTVVSLIHTPKAISRDTGRPAIIYAHGGGCIAGSANIYKQYLSTMASVSGVVVFNVDYRLAPETLCPNNVLDFYHSVKYIVANADKLGIDPKRIAIAGESGGGYVCAGAMVKLAQENESSLVKLAIPIIAQISSYCFGPTRGMTKQELESNGLMKAVWRVVAGTDNIKEKFDDPFFFPGDVSDDIIAMMPPTIIWEAEFDIFITENFRFANKLRSAGRLLEFVVIPGGKHGSDLDPSKKCFQTNQEAMRVAVQEYLVKSE